jgi:hypothetical protein
MWLMDDINLSASPSNDRIVRARFKLRSPRYFATCFKCVEVEHRLDLVEATQRVQEFRECIECSTRGAGDEPRGTASGLVEPPRVAVVIPGGRHAVRAESSRSSSNRLDARGSPFSESHGRSSRLSSAIGHRGPPTDARARPGELYERRRLAPRQLPTTLQSALLSRSVESRACRTRPTSTN